MSDESSLVLLVGIWTIAAAIVVASRWRRAAVSVGLPFAFLLNFWLIHWPAAVIYLIPSYLYFDIEDNFSLTVAGFQQSTYAIIGFTLGSLVFAPFLTRLFQTRRLPMAANFSESRLAKTYLAIGVIFFFVQFFPIRGLQALFAAGLNFLVLGVGLLCRKAWLQKQTVALVGWLVLALSLPLITVLTMGLMLHGAWLFFCIVAFFASFYRPRWKLIVSALLVCYLGISLYGTYTRDKAFIRQVVWDEQATLRDRVGELYFSLSTFEWFNPSNLVHLYWIDSRLNMNRQVGEAMSYLESGNVEYAAGATLWWSAIGMVPRLLWPNKPTVAGGSDFVSKYTGVEFGEGTTVTVGLVTEFYVNYGAPAVFLGYLCLGMILAAIDSAAGRCLSKGDWRAFSLWFLPGQALVKAEITLVEVTTSAGGAVVLALLVNRFFLRAFWRQKHSLPGVQSSIPLETDKVASG